jgi:hypothetical protein
MQRPSSIIPAAAGKSQFVFGYRDPGAVGETSKYKRLEVTGMATPFPPKL